MLFGLVANRALAPSSKLAAADWITHDVHIDGLPETSDDVYYRATHGKSKDSHDDLPQIVIGMAVTATGSRCGCGAGPATPTTKH